MIKLVNKHYPEKVEIGTIIINIMRGTPLGNPIKITTRKDRMQVLKEYRIWLWKKVKSNDNSVMKALFEIAQYDQQGKTVLLECCCTPKKCHGNIIIACLGWLYSTNAYRGSPKYGGHRDAYTLCLDESNDDY